MNNLRESLVDVASYALSWRERVEILWIVTLQVFKLAKQIVKLLVGNCWSVKHIIVIVVAVEFSAKLINPLFK